MYRVEDKYCCSEHEMFFLQARLQSVLCADSHQSREQGYQITSVYFDDYKNSCLLDAENGVRYRKKYRIRIYDDKFDVIKLEMKFKKDSRIYKKSQTITYEQMMELLKGKCIQREKEKDDVIAQFNLAILTAGLTPKVIVEYDRKAFIYQGGNVRITLDRNIRVSKNISDFYMRNKTAYRMLPEMNRVIEVKYDEFLPGFISRILELGNMNQTSFSKYCLCRRMENY